MGVAVDENDYGSFLFPERMNQKSVKSGPNAAFLKVLRSLHQETSLPLLVSWRVAFSRVEVLAYLELFLDCWCRCQHCNVQAVDNIGPNNLLHKLLR